MWWQQPLRGVYDGCGVVRGQRILKHKFGMKFCRGLEKFQKYGGQRQKTWRGGTVTCVKAT